MRLLATALILLLLPVTAFAECVGQNLIAALPADQRAALQAAADASPYARGNFWTATRGGQTITLIGTFHLDDPRHDTIVASLSPMVLAATTLLVEAGPEEEAALLAHVAKHPELLVNQTGPTLPEALPEADWLRLSDALRARSIPPFFAAKMQPWYVSTLLAVPACQFAQTAAQNGLDRRLMAVAKSAGVTIASLEPFDTIFTIFDGLASSDQLKLLVQTLDAIATNDDSAITLSDSYFAGESRLYWEFSRLQLQTRSGLSAIEAERELDAVNQAMIIKRNHSWIDKINTEAAKGPLVVAFGALHLSGEDGVLNLLAQDGWTITSVDP